MKENANKPRIGRPPKGDDARNDRISLAVNAAEKSELDAAANEAGLPLSEWMRQELLRLAGTGKQPKKRSN